MWKYHDIETNETITLEELKKEYQLLAESNAIDCQTFDEYLENCLTRNNGTLEIVYN